jgi:hypothetical protein
MKFRYLHIPYYFGLAIIAIGILFRIQHWLGYDVLVLAGVVLELTTAILVVIEITTSGKATKHQKILWAINYSLFPLLAVWLFPGLLLLLLFFLGGTDYLNRGRKNFIETRRDINNFDSF